MNQLHLPKLSKVNKTLIILLVGCFLFETVLSANGLSLKSTLGLVPSSFLSGSFFQLFTFPWISQGLMALLFNSLILWFLGSELEDMWGLRRYLYFMGSIFLGEALIHLSLGYSFFPEFINFPLLGVSGLCLGLCLAYGILFPERAMYLYLFPVKAKWFVAIIVAIQLFQVLSSGGGAYHALSRLGAMASAFLWMLAQAKGSFTLPFQNKINDLKKEKVMRERSKRVKGSHLHLVDDEAQDDKNDTMYH